ncbi:hypothetical protein AD930_11020 [Acetobacter malorum]|nr:hypothetical protein AD930_11020 [Acetobacter malorum]
MIVRFEEMLRRWKAIFTGKPQDYEAFSFSYPGDEPADFEDWCENAALLLGLLDLGRPVLVVSSAHVEIKTLPWGASLPISSQRNNIGQPILALNGASDDIPDIDINGTSSPGPSIILGMGMKADGSLIPGAWPKSLPGKEIFTHNAETDPASNYWRNPAFKRLAGREFDIGAPEDQETNEYPDVKQIIRSMTDKHDRYVTKILTSHKHWPLWFSPAIPAGQRTEKQIEHEMYEAFDYELEHHDPFVLVSEYVEMFYEYRIFFVAGKVVCGAGCIESFSPPWNDGEAFDLKVEKHRNGSEVVKRPALIKRYVDFAQKAIDEFGRHDPAFLHGVIDLALMRHTDNASTSARPRVEIGVIEVNSARSAGQYALRTDLFVKALAEAMDAEVNGAKFPGERSV